MEIRLTGRTWADSMYSKANSEWTSKQQSITEARIDSTVTRLPPSWSFDLWAPCVLSNPKKSFEESDSSPTLSRAMLSICLLVGAGFRDAPASDFPSRATLVAERVDVGSSKSHGDRRDSDPLLA